MLFYKNPLTRTHDEFRRSSNNIINIFSVVAPGWPTNFGFARWSNFLFVFCSVFFFLFFFCSFSFRSCRVNCFGKLFYKASKLQKVCFQKNTFWKLLFCVSSCALSFSLPCDFFESLFLALTNDQCGKIMIRKKSQSRALLDSIG